MDQVLKEARIMFGGEGWKRKCRRYRVNLLDETTLAKNDLLIADILVERSNYVELGLIDDTRGY